MSVGTPHAARRTLLLLAVLAAPAESQVAPSGTWRTLHSEHFRIHFRPAYRAVAVEAAAEAERAYALLATELHRPRGTIDVTLADDFDAPNGFAATYPSNRITILLVPPVADPALQFYDSWRRLVIVHELAHVFHLDRSRGLWGALQAVFGRAPGLFPNHYQPSWVIEGLATYYESRFTGAGRADASFHRQIVGADAAAGAARSPWDALSFTRWPDGIVPYAYGSRFWDHLGRATSDSTVPRFVESTAGQLIPFRVGRPLRRVGAPRALTADWADAIAAAAPVDTAVASRRIAGALQSQPVPRVSPDGQQVAFLHDDGRGARRLRVMDLASGRAARSHRVNGQVSYDWLGDTLIVAQLEFLDRWHVRSDLWRWTPGSPHGGWRRVTHGARLMEPRADASLALLAGDNAPVLARASPPPPDPPGTTWGAVVPSPDGRWVVASRHQDGRWALVRWATASPESIAVLAQPAGGVADPVWGRDGRGVLYVSDVAGFPQVHLWTDDGGILQLTAEPFGARAPASLPDGTILFTTLAADGWELRRATPAPRAAADAQPQTYAAFDSAPPVSVRETGYAAFGSLRPHFWLPLIFDAAETGRFFGGVTAGADAVGRHAYLVQGLVSFAPLRAQGAVYFLTHALGSPTLDFLASNDWAHVGTSPTSGRFVSRGDFDAGVGATLVVRRWRRFASLRLAAEYEGERFVATPDTILADVCAGCRRRDLVGGSLSLSAGSLVTAPLAVSPVEGAAVSVLYRRREEQGSGRWSDEARARLALYARIGPRVSFASPVLAARLAAGAITGTIPRRLSVGGVSSGVMDLALGTTLGMTRAFPVRGYDAGELYGQRVATVAVEYRVPLALVGKSLGHLPLGADKLSLALFGDAGDAWDAGQDARLHRLRSVGLELVGDVTVGYDLPLRIRAGIAQPAGGHPRAYAAFAADF